MTKIFFVEFDGTEHEVEAEDGESLMAAAINNGIPGIDGDCGGDCMCGTCHIILDREGYEKVGGPIGNENEMLSLTPELEETSRLSCQVQVTSDLDGLVVRLPEFQM